MNPAFDRIKTFVFDVDGVLTDGTVTLMPNGEQVRHMFIKDGYALQLAVKQGFEVIVISGGRSEWVKQRLESLGIRKIFLGIARKIETFESLCRSQALIPSHALYMGDDMPDYEVMQKVAIAACPSDAATDIKQISHYISPMAGGKGAVRDVIEKALRAQGKWFSNDAFVW